MVATVLYNEMLGSVPNFQNGAVVAMMMLLPSVLSISLLHYLERYNVRYNKISTIEITKNRRRDFLCGLASAVILLSILSVFAVIFVVPFVEEWPYRTNFTLSHVTEVFRDSSLLGVYKNSLLMAVLTALAGLITTYGAALPQPEASWEESGKVSSRALPW